MMTHHTMQDETTLRQIVRDLAHAWNQRDGRAFARPFSDDAHYRVLWGQKIQGQDAIAEGHQAIFDNQYRTSHMDIEVETIRFLRPDIAYVEAACYLRNVETPFERTIVSMALVKEANEWRIVTLNNAGILPHRPVADPGPQ